VVAQFHAKAPFSALLEAEDEHGMHTLKFNQEKVRFSPAFTKI
jgi:hypothetical protein